MSVFRHRRIAVGHAALNFDGAPSGIQHAAELDHEAVAHHFEYPTSKADDCRVEKLAAVLFQGVQRAFFIGLHKAAVANHVRREYCRKPTLDRRILRFGIRGMSHVKPRSGNS